MSLIYIEETKKMNVISHLEEIRRRILYCLTAFIIFAIFSFLKGDAVMPLINLPVHGIVHDFIFICPTEAFAAYVKIALLFGFIASFPFMVYHAGAFFVPAVPREKRKRVVLWLTLALILFFSGIAFAYFLAIPVAFRFLIGFGERIACARIAIGKYVAFFTALILTGGLIFEIPVIIGLLVDIGFLRISTLKKKRQYVFLLIMIFAAIFTPTQDIFNMLIFAVPMLLLYEIGILAASFAVKKSNRI